jgi:hypothetical protein
VRALALVLILLCSPAAFAEDGVHLQTCSGRGWLTGTGLAVAGGGAVALILAAFEATQADGAARTVAAYYAHGAAPTAAEAATVRWMEERSDIASNQALAFLGSGAAALVMGVGLVLLDGWLGRASMTVAIQPSGASVLVTGRF